MRQRLLALFLAAALITPTGASMAGGPPAAPGARAPAPRSEPASADSVRSQDLIQPAELARLLKGPAGKRPVLIHVGFKSLYGEGHIPGSWYDGPASKPEGIAALKSALAPLPRKSALVLYCGCCPWQDCPNVRPAYRTAREMGFSNVRVMFIARNLQHDWAEQGWPITARGK